MAESLPLFPAKGCFYRYSKGKGSKYYKLSPDLGSSTDVPILIQGVSRTLSDITAPTAYLGNLKKFYTFGQSFGQINISGIALLGPTGSVNNAEQIIDEYYQTNRCTNESGKPIKVSSGGKATVLFLTGLRFDSPDTERHILPFTLIGIVVEPKK